MVQVGKNCLRNMIIVYLSPFPVIVPLIIYIGNIIIMGDYLYLVLPLPVQRNTSDTIRAASAFIWMYSFPAWVRI